MLFGQLDYPQELGIGEGYTIKQYGCALVSVSSLLVNVFGKDTDPTRLNDALIALNNENDGLLGFSSNNAGAYDLLNWNAITRLFPDITLLFNNTYYNPPSGTGQPADMQLIDDQLARGFSVIVGVSFNHNTNEEFPTHYVEVYKKDNQGIYHCRDPWFKDDTNFNDRYAVNGMDVAQCILQAISYTGQLPVVNTATMQSSGVTPAAEYYKGLDLSNKDSMRAAVDVWYAVTQGEYVTKQAFDSVTSQRDECLRTSKETSDTYAGDLTNYKAIKAAGYVTVDDVTKALKGVNDENDSLTRNLIKAKERNSNLADEIRTLEKEDVAGLHAALDAKQKLSDVRTIASAWANALGTELKLVPGLRAIDYLKSKYQKAPVVEKQTVAKIEETFVSTVGNAAEFKNGVGDMLLILFGFKKAVK